MSLLNGKPNVKWVCVCVCGAMYFFLAKLIDFGLLKSAILGYSTNILFSVKQSWRLRKRQAAFLKKHAEKQAIL